MGLEHEVWMERTVSKFFQCSGKTPNLVQTFRANTQPANTIVCICSEIGKETRSRKRLLWEPPLLGKQMFIFCRSFWILLHLWVIDFFSCVFRASALLGLIFIFKIVFCFEAGLPGACYSIKWGPRHRHSERQETNNISCHLSLSWCPHGLNILFVPWGKSMGHKSGW